MCPRDAVTRRTIRSNDLGPSIDKCFLALKCLQTPCLLYTVHVECFVDVSTVDAL